MYDLCALLDDVQLLCQDYEAYTQLCQEEGVALGPWREKTGCGEEIPVGAPDPIGLGGHNSNPLFLPRKPMRLHTESTVGLPLCFLQ